MPESDSMPTSIRKGGREIGREGGMQRQGTAGERNWRRPKGALKHRRMKGEQKRKGQVMGTSWLGSKVKVPPESIKHAKWHKDNEATGGIKSLTMQSENTVELPADSLFRVAMLVALSHQMIVLLFIVLSMVSMSATAFIPDALCVARNAHFHTVFIGWDSVGWSGSLQNIPGP